MDGQAVMTVSAATTGLVQLAKWAGLKDAVAPLAVLLVAAAGVLFWGWSTGTLARATAFGYFAGWVAVSTSSAGIFGFTRAAATAVTSTTPPPPGEAGAGSSPTVKS